MEPRENLTAARRLSPDRRRDFAFPRASSPPTTTETLAAVSHSHTDRTGPSVLGAHTLSQRAPSDGGPVLSPKDSGMFTHPPLILHAVHCEQHNHVAALNIDPDRLVIRPDGLWVSLSTKEFDDLVTMCLGVFDTMGGEAS
jgi:hypothetical protein